jgi:hypothetical protein
MTAHPPPSGAALLPLSDRSNKKPDESYLHQAFSRFAYATALQRASAPIWFGGQMAIILS